MSKIRFLLSLFLSLIPLGKVPPQIAFSLTGFATFITFENEVKAESAEFYIDKSYESEERGDYEEALFYLNKAIKIDSKDSNSYYLRGWIKKKLKDSIGALEDFERAVEINPEDEDSYFQIGFLKAKSKDYYGSINAYNIAIKLDKTNPISFYNRGLSKSNIGFIKGAISDYNRAIEINPNYADAYYNLGNLAKDSKDFYLAISYYNKVIKIDSNFEAYTNRGISKSEIGDKKGACDDYKKAINVGSVSTKKWLATSSGKWCREM